MVSSLEYLEKACVERIVSIVKNIYNKCNSVITVHYYVKMLKIKD